VIDRLLFKLDSEKLINTKTDKFKFIGIGYGGFILQSYSKEVLIIFFVEKFA